MNLSLTKPITATFEQTTVLRMRIRTRGLSRHCSENHPTALKTHVNH